MLGFLIYFSTVAFVPHLAFIFVFFFALYINKNEIATYIQKSINQGKIPVNRNVIIILLIILFSFINNLLFNSEEKVLYPYYFLLFATYYIALKLKKSDIKIIIIFIGFEAIIGIFEYFAGISSIIPGYEIPSISSREHLLYYSRVFGLSSNSSVFAFKLMIGLLLIDYIKLRSLTYRLVQFVLLIAVFVSFNRTVMVSLVLYYGIQILLFSKITVFSILKRKVRIVNLIISIIFLFLFIVGLVFVLLNYQEIIIQFTRNTGKLELTGRDYIWSEFADFIKQNFYFGNGSYKYYINYFGRRSHAHNSYIEILATNGIFIAILYFSFVLLNIKKANFIYILIFLVFSILQHGIFWGISLADIILYFMLLRDRESIINGFGKLREEFNEIIEERSI